MNCKKCGKPIINNAKFCTVCGTPTVEEMKPDSQKEMKVKKKKSFVWLWLFLAVLFLLFAIIGVGAFFFLQSDYYKVYKQVKLSEKYIEELNYDEAIAELMVALEINPENKEALECLEKVCMLKAKELEDNEEYDELLSLLMDCQGYLASDAIEVKIEEISRIKEEKEKAEKEELEKKKEKDKETDKEKDKTEEETEVSIPEEIVNSSEWADAYLSYVEDKNYSDFSYGYIYLNDDDIPELVMQGTCEAEGNIILTYGDGGVDDLYTSRLYFAYIERGNLLDNSDGHMGYYYDYIYGIEDGKWKEVAAGEFGYTGSDYDYSAEDMEYSWNGRDVSYEKYYEELGKIFNSSKSISFEGNFTYDDIIRDLESKKSNDSITSDVSDFFSDKSGINDYQIYADDVTWSEAERACKAKGGHLVSINSDEEYNYITDWLNDNSYSGYVIWIGGKFNPSDNHYHWYNNGKYEETILDTQKPFREYWLDGEPSYEGEDGNGNIVDEHYMDMFFSSRLKKYVWNDVPEDISQYYPGKIAYICEYE